jgi:cysteine desulfurase
LFALLILYVMILRMKFWNKKQERVYLDWAAATPLSPEAFSAMEPFLKNQFGNPSAIHQEGMITRKAVEGAREVVARAIQVRPEFVTFTSGGTEANNLAILGSIEYLNKSGQDYNAMEVITTRIEHPSVLKTIEQLKRLGVVIKYVDVSPEGKIRLSHLREMVSEKTILLCCSYINSEIGTIQPLHGIRKILLETEKKFNTNILLHVDAAQAPLWVSCQFDSVGADFLTLDSAKCCGPKGVGVLILSKRAKVTAVSFGGGQEQGLRPGTENVAGIVGASVSISWAEKGWRQRAGKVSKVRDEAIKYILDQIPGAILNGAVGEERVANNINISITGLDTEYTAVVLDKNGFAVSTKSACAGAGGGESSVVKEISGDPARASSTLRLTLGPDTTLDEIIKLTAVLRQHTDKMKGYKLQ